MSDGGMQAHEGLGYDFFQMFRCHGQESACAGCCLQPRRSGRRPRPHGCSCAGVPRSSHRPGHVRRVRPRSLAAAWLQEMLKWEMHIVSQWKVF